MSPLAISDALYAASGRVSAAHAVVHCIVRSLPCGDHVKPIMDEVNLLGDLGAAACDLLTLLAQDIERLEVQLAAA